MTVVSLKTFTVADHYTKSAADTLLAAKSPLASPSFTGSVGIGTSSPSTKLEVKSSIATDYATTIPWNTYTNDTVVLTNPDVGSTGNYASIALYAGGSSGSFSSRISSVASSSGNGAITFQLRSSADTANTTERMRIDSSGHAIIGGGVTLGNGQTYAAANTLDDYEEGTWTPTTPNGSWTIASATYTKVGQLVTCHFDVRASATISAAGDFTGLPFTPTNNSAGVVGYQNSEGGTIFGILVQTSPSWNFRVGATQKGLANSAYARGVFSYITA